MRVLYISSLIFKKASSASIRNVSLINGMIENGHEVDVLTIKYPDEYQDSYLVNNLSDDVNVYCSELKILNRYLNNKVKNGDVKKRTNTFDFAKGIIKTLYFFPDTDKEWIHSYNKDFIERKYDIIISSSDTKTAHFIALELKKKGKCDKWYQIWGDPWKDDININKINKFRASRKESFFIKKADKVFYVSLPTTQIMKSKFMQMSSKINFLGRSYLNKCYGGDIGSQNEWILTYTGSISRNRNILCLIQKIQVYNNENSKQIRLRIYGHVYKDILDEINKYSFIDLKGSVDFSNIQNVYQNSDVLIFTDNGSNTSQIPGKLYDYFGTDRPILALVDDINSSVSKFIISTGRCIIKENRFDKIEFDFLNNLEKKYVVKEFSGSSTARRIFEKNE
ncbi:putative glycosyltransferase [Clostridium aceticum]|uniref:Putative glycosyltransferase n=1 Tax=Clostridium aceticum TaxID=84022 RepID=A0A0D8IAB5_9CLOT|nr:hypothetical protein [Clostridium aceticum]AKL93660.1 putative glycosyltransferase [Clostridium aceticum]KJF27235.1 hypothetical protein TZ02_09240 [Clostridium aceticum]